MAARPNRQGAPIPAASGLPSVVLVCGEDEFAVKQRAREIFVGWCGTDGGLDQDLLDASVTSSSEALKALDRLGEALQTLPFFGKGKVVWFRDCNFLAEERHATTQVTERLELLARQLKEFNWSEPCPVRLLISAGKVDKRKVFYKTLDKLGAVESFSAWTVDSKDWADEAETWARKALKTRRKEISDQALAELIERVGPNARALDSEIEKLSLYSGDGEQIEVADVRAITSRNKSARAFALGDALGDRDLPNLLRRLDEELWEVKLDPKKSEIGLLYGLIAKVRAMLMLKEMLREGWIKPEANYPRFKAQLERVPAEQLPKDRRFNPLSLNPYVLYNALPQVNRYSQAELVRAMEILLQANRRLVSSQLDQALVLQQALVEIVGTPTARPAPAAA